jgi:hypothetical protein
MTSYMVSGGRVTSRSLLLAFYLLICNCTLCTNITLAELVLFDAELI